MGKLLYFLGVTLVALLGTWWIGDLLGLRFNPLLFLIVDVPIAALLTVLAFRRR